MLRQCFVWCRHIYDDIDKHKIRTPRIVYMIYVNVVSPMFSNRVRIVTPLHLIQ